MDAEGPYSLIPQLRLDDLLAELQVRLQGVLDTRDRTHALLEAVVAVGSHLDLEVVLRQIVEAAVRLVGCRYGALGVVGEGGTLAEFVPVGLDESEVAAVDHWPEGHGLLGELITNPRPLRLPDMAADSRSAGFPPGHPPMNSFLGTPIRIRDEVFGNLYLTEKQGYAEFDEDDEALLVTLASAAGVAVENARLYAEARRQQQWLRANAEVTQRLLSEDEPHNVLALVTRLALEMSGADLVVLALPVGDRDELVIEHAVGAAADAALGLVLPARGSASGIVMASGKPLRVEDFSTDQRVAQAARAQMSLGPAVFVPLGAPGDVRGVLTAGRRKGSLPLSPPAVDMLITFAAQAGIGLELADHRRDAQQFALFEDRDRIARDLHDLVIQRLFATGMSLQGSAGLIADPQAASRVRQAVDALDETIKDIRSAIFTLQARPQSGAAGVRTAVLAIVAEMTGLLGFAPAVRLDERLDALVPGEIAEHLLAALREGLSNTARHAGASKVFVAVTAGPDLVLSVRDNGGGMAETTRRSGLGNLGERAGNLGGTMRLSAATGGGTELEWRVPLPGGGSRDG
ncbi:MAG TPA: GAF domain-containing protein [Streptosporangiaceae bacterium]|jgi:signal transduction histidine kinase